MGIRKSVQQGITETVEAITSPTWQGRLDLTYTYRDRATQIVNRYMQAPLKVQRPFYPEGKDVCHSVILHTAGGIVGGDRLSLNLNLEPQANALITTAAAGKVYRSNGKEATQTAAIKIEEGANLEWLPQETIVFNGAIYRQEIRIELAPSASLLLWDMTRFGRSARGEKFLSGEWRSHTEIWQQGRPLWIDRQFLKGGEEMLESPYCLAGEPAIATLVWIGQPITSELLETVRSLSNPCNGDPSIGSPSHGITRLEQGLIARYRGSSTQAARDWFIPIWNLLRLSFKDRSSCLPRVWPCSSFNRG